MASHGKTAKVTFAPHNQKLETVQAVVASLIGRTGCHTCGRLINIALEFQGDPEPDQAKNGVISIQTEGF